MRALEDAGWSVWWDREILPGVSYEQVIETDLSAARCVVVLWSSSARQSNWVRDEATLALSRAGDSFSLALPARASLPDCNGK